MQTDLPEQPDTGAGSEAQPSNPETPPAEAQEIRAEQADAPLAAIEDSLPDSGGDQLADAAASLAAGELPSVAPTPPTARVQEPVVEEAEFHNPPEPAGEPSGWMHRLAGGKWLWILGLISLLLIGIAMVGAWYFLGQLSSVGGQEAIVTPPASLDDLATEYPQMGNVLNDPKLASVYKDFLLAYQQGGLDAAYEWADRRGLLNAKDDLRLTLVLDTTETADLKAQLEAYGVQVTTANRNEIDIVIPRVLLEQLVVADDPAVLFEQISGLEHIIQIKLPMPDIRDDDGVLTESVPIIKADAWHAAGITGQGVKVGVLDMGFDSYRNLLGTDLPAQVTARSFISGVEIDQAGTVHGAAVAEIIHDIAPDAELFLAAYDTDAEEREAVDWLLSNGVDIISHSAGTTYGPMDGSAAESMWVDQIVNDGVLWVNSAGNCGTTHYRATFTDTDGDGYHEFAPGDELMAFIPDGRTVFVLNWDDWGRGQQDYDLYIYDENENEIASSTDVQDGPEDDAAEGVIYTFSDSRVYYLAFYKSRSNRDVLFNFFMRDGQIEYYTPEYSVTTPGDARRSLTVGAVNWSDDVLEDYSSQGPTNDGRLKPEIAAPSGVSSAAYGTTWIGTSASAPHVSGAAALVLQVYPNFTPDQVSEFLRSRAVDLGQNGPDTVFGFGRLDLGDPYNLPPAPPIETPVIQGATAVPLPTSTLMPTVTAASATATPERVVLETPVSSQTDAVGAAVVGLVACVALPGMLGLGGIGLFAGVWYWRSTRSRQMPIYPNQHGRSPRPQPSRGEQHYPQVYSQPAPPQWTRYPPPGSSSPGIAAQDLPVPGAPAAPVVDEGMGSRATPAPVGGKSEVLHDAEGHALCPRCGTSYRLGARFCSTCGTNLASITPQAEEIAFCTKCGFHLRANSKFCPNCGAQRRA